jgi:hypothetical protein
VSEPSTPITQQIFDSLTGIWAELARLAEAASTRLTWLVTETLNLNGNKITAGTDENGEPQDMEFEAASFLFKSSGVFRAEGAIFPSLYAVEVGEEETLTPSDWDGVLALIRGDSAAVLTIGEGGVSPTSGRAMTIAIGNFSTGLSYVAPENGVVLRYADTNGIVQSTTDEILLGFGMTLCICTGDNEWSIV